jgi:hypothetical protein
MLDFDPNDLDMKEAIHENTEIIVLMEKRLQRLREEEEKNNP